MILIRGNVERIADNPAQIEKLIAAGFVPINNNWTADIKAMDIKQLRVIASEKGIGDFQSLTKAELLKVLKEVV